MPIAEIKTVCFVGAGTMGCANALIAAVSGYDVVLHDISMEILNKVAGRQREMAAYLVSTGYCGADAVDAARQRTTLVPDLRQATAKADLVSESVLERLDLKREVHRQLDELCPPGTILTTNTSALLVSDIEDVVGRGDRFAALHSHLGTLLIDIVGGPRTSPGTIDILKRYVMSLRCIPMVLKKEHRGYLLNAMLGPVLATGVALVIGGAATLEDVDRAWMIHRKAPMGPFGMMDLFGLNLILDSWQHQKPKPGLAELRGMAIAFLAPYVERGELGMKSGKGFYAYPDPAYRQEGFLEAAGDVSIPHYALTVALIQNALLLAASEVAEPQEIDRAWMAGMMLDVGPFGILDQIGIDTFVSLSDSQPGALTADDAARVAAFLQPYIDRDELGEKCGQGFYTHPEPRYSQPGFILDMG
ncbi:MAG: 3-hydroxyacyl-CoA dehydrogenase NAD-binding domain-containing protein [Steroidobacteraceae bacterium]